ncbi:MAG: DUF4349 domain-containing protein [Actinomycetota bacterium]
MNKRVLATIVVLVFGAAAAAWVRGADRAAETSGIVQMSGGDSGNAVAELMPPVVTSRDEAEEDALFAAEQGKVEVAPNTGVGSELPALPDALPGSTRVIKNVSLQIEIEKGLFQRQFARAGTLAEQFQGFVSGSQVSRSEEGDLASGTLTIRVPADRFEQAVGRLKELGEVTAEDRTGQDVTREFVDLEARLKHAQTEEAFYLRLMSEAKTVSDMIQVQGQLSGVQLRIEEFQGQLQYLRDQTAYSTITATIYEPGASPLGQPKPLTQAWEEAVNGFQSVVSGAVVGLGWILPFVLAGLIGLTTLRLGRKSRSKRISDPGPSPS